jgi:hypothetical protein
MVFYICLSPIRVLCFPGCPRLKKNTKASLLETKALPAMIAIPQSDTLYYGTYAPVASYYTNYFNSLQLLQSNHDRGSDRLIFWVQSTST